MFIGGAETLLSRQTKFLIDKDYYVDVLLEHSGDSLDLLSHVTRIKVLNKPFFHLYDRSEWRIFFRNIEHSYDAIIGMGLRPGFWASLIQQRLIEEGNYSPKLLIGAYHPREITLSGRNRESYWLSYWMKECIYDSSLLFMSNQVKSSIEKDCETTFKTACVCPIAVDGGPFSEVNRKPVKFRIVSVGRLEPWKTYNYYMIDVINKLHKMGYPVTYDIYGDGAERNKIQGIINKYGLGNTIRLHGNIPYDHFPAVLSTAYAFIGMGTSMIEAGFAKVPSIVAIDNFALPLSYGYLYHLPLYTCGELLQKPPEVEVTQLLIELFSMNQVQYQSECEKIYQYVQEYSMDNIMSIWQRFLNLSPNILRSPNKNKFIHSLAYIYNRFRNIKLMLVDKSFAIGQMKHG